MKRRKKPDIYAGYPIHTDPFGSYTGQSKDGKPVQDADDL